MPTTLTIHATERSTYVITAAFADEDGESSVPNDLTWTLTDRAGRIINSRENVIVTPASEIDIVLTDDDLQLGSSLSGDTYILLIEGTYDSTLGTGLSLRDQARFTIDNLLAVTG